jgi:hypothetical protein
MGKGWDCNRIYGLFGGDSRELLARMESAHGEPIIDNGLAGADGLSACSRAGHTCCTIPIAMLAAVRGGVSFGFFFTLPEIRFLQAAFWIGRPW